jgi:hypothetical protein
LRDGHNFLLFRFLLISNTKFITKCSSRMVPYLNHS